MPLTVTCDCGRTLRLKEELAGRKVRCPSCAGALTVPEPESEEAEEEILERTGRVEPDAHHKVSRRLGHRRDIADAPPLAADKSS